MPFKGYFRAGDPRSPFFGAAGSFWPTVPPFRWRLGSQDATGSWSFLKTTGVLLENPGFTGHDFCSWSAISGQPACFTRFDITREFPEDWLLVVYRLVLKTPCSKRPWVSMKMLNPGKANKNVVFKSIFTPLGPPGDVGRTLTAYQVEFDEENPPGGWPPW